MESGCKSEKHLTRVWAYRRVSYYNSRDYRVAVRFSRNVSSTEYRSNPTGRCGAREKRESVLKERKRLQMFLGVICMWEKRRAHTNTHTKTEKKRERGRGAWRNENMNLHFSSELCFTSSSFNHTHTLIFAINSLFSLFYRYTHTRAGVCIQTLKPFHQQPSATFQLPHTHNGYMLQYQVCVCVCAHLHPSMCKQH